MPLPIATTGSAVLFSSHQFVCVDSLHLCLRVSILWHIYDSWWFLRILRVWNFISAENPVKFTITLFGTKRDLMNKIGCAILNNNNFVEMENDLVIGENELFRIIIIPDFFKDDCPYPDQLIIDLMAHSDSGIHLFIVATDNHDEIKHQISRLTHFSIKPVKQQLLTIIANNENSSIILCFETSQLSLEMDKLADYCYCVCESHGPFLSQDTDYSKKVVDRRKAELKRKR